MWTMSRLGIRLLERRLSFDLVNNLTELIWRKVASYTVREQLYVILPMNSGLKVDEIRIHKRLNLFYFSKTTFN